VRFLPYCDGMDATAADQQTRWRALVRASVAARRPVDARERDSIAEFLNRFDALAQPFDEHADPVHVTASAIVIGPRGVVLHRHKRLGLWLQPGGHIDTGEAPWDAALREAREETGLPVGFPGRIRINRRRWPTSTCTPARASTATSTCATC
jgi:hypothetical protein